MSKLKTAIKYSYLKVFSYNKLEILSPHDSLKLLNETKKSVCRFGDGEFDIILNKNLSIQDYSKELTDRLKEILASDNTKCYCALPEPLSYMKGSTPASKKYWSDYLFRNKAPIINLINKNRKYLSAYLSRFYYRYTDKSTCEENFKLLKNLWSNKDVLIVEGEHTQFGVNNDFLSDALSIHRIICPDENSFSKYTKILKVIQKFGKEKIILLCLGPTATILAWDLAELGYTAIDIGKADIEYEWFLQKATSKVSIPGKYNCEISTDKKERLANNEAFTSQIVYKI